MKTNNITHLRTPYHALGQGTAPVVPAWARTRSVYRSAGRTLYLVETDSLATAQQDLDHLSRSGWDVHVDSTDNSTASIAFSRSAA